MEFIRSRTQLNCSFCDARFISNPFDLKRNEEKFSTLEEKTADALEMAAQAHEKRTPKEANTRVSVIVLK